ncbi:hypothetical protein Q9S36_15350 [Microbacterium sp. ARD31]|jgi:hypothetical protein|uniref:hypothetical protein n=1 Tax=Microbacterium sp. ARD31 TaxID=2962576 RepID=UPI0028821878|nr:hypothetical protein [Microbacterium sp. ARD31]MDT0181553.1 hypothetical protein [Microbacterium sp. ARD31]
MHTPPALAEPRTPPALGRPRPVRLIGAGPSLWRVVDGRGVVIGHLQRLDDDRYRARRLRFAAHGFVDIGDFWSADDAVSALHDSR